MVYATGRVSGLALLHMHWCWASSFHSFSNTNMSPAKRQLSHIRRLFTQGRSLTRHSRESGNLNAFTSLLPESSPPVIPAKAEISTPLRHCCRNLPHPSFPRKRESQRLYFTAAGIFPT